MREFTLFRQDMGSGNFPPPPPPPPVYSTPPPPPPPPGSFNQSGASSNAIISLVLGILSFIMCPVIFGIGAWIMGKKELAEINSGRSSEAGRMIAKIGMWLGILNVILSCIGIIIFAILMVLGVFGSLMNG
ncbi:MAG: DUF4190 domain-containing protein [Ignavibacteria bacterium]